MSEYKVLYKITSHNSDYIKNLPDKVLAKDGTIYHYYDFKNHRYLSVFINDNFNIYDEISQKTKENQQLKEQLERSEKARKEALSIIKSKQEIIPLSTLGYDIIKLINILEMKG